MIYNLLKRKIERGSFVREDNLAKMDVFLLENRITNDNYTELVALMDAKEAAAE